MSVTVLGSFPLGTIHVAANGSVAVASPLVGLVDQMLTGPTGLGSLVRDLANQLAAAKQASVSLGLNLTNPITALKQQLLSIARVQAGIASTLAFGLPPVSASLSAKIGGANALAGLLASKLATLKNLLDQALAKKLEAVSFFGGLSGNLGVGGTVLITIGYTGVDTLASAGSQINALCSAGVGGIHPGDTVYGVLLLTSSPSAAAALASIMKTV